MSGSEIEGCDYSPGLSFVYIPPFGAKDLQISDLKLRSLGVEPIASERGCGVSGGLTVTGFFLGCMKIERVKGVSF